MRQSQPASVAQFASSARSTAAPQAQTMGSGLASCRIETRTEGIVMWWMDLQPYAGPPAGLVLTDVVSGNAKESYPNGVYFIKRADGTRTYLGKILEIEYFMFGEFAGKSKITYVQGE